MRTMWIDGGFLKMPKKIDNFIKEIIKTSEADLNEGMIDLLLYGTASFTIDENKIRRINYMNFSEALELLSKENC